MVSERRLTDTDCMFGALVTSQAMRKAGVSWARMPVMLTLCWADAQTLPAKLPRNFHAMRVEVG